MFVATLIMAIAGSFMIASAEMGNAAGDMDYLTGRIIKQLILTGVALVAGYFLSIFNLEKLIKKKTRGKIIEFGAWILYFVCLALLLLCLAFEPINGANAWITITSGFTVQPSEFGKIAVILLGAAIFSVDHKEKNVRKFWAFAIASLVYVFIILVLQHDTGSAVVLALIAYCVALVPDYKELKKIHKWMLVLVVVAVIVFCLLMSPSFNEWLSDLAEDTEDYRIARIIVAYNPFNYEYDYGYHLIMSLVCFAQGGIRGMGWNKSIHKYMNFPNPSSDFILPVMVEELGIGGFIGFVVLYCAMLGPLIYYSIKIKKTGAKIIIFGTFLYFIVHFILNVGGVSGFIPLTGVPILLLSSGGSSLLSGVAAIGLCQNAIERYNEENENNSREI